MADLISDVKINDTIKFKSKANNDPTEYYGKVVSMCSYDLAKTYNDVHSYNNNVAIFDVVNGEITPPVEECEFIIVRLLEQSQESLPKYLISFAKEWIEPTSFIIVSVFSRIDLTVFSVSSEADGENILAALKQAGYIAKITKSY